MLRRPPENCRDGVVSYVGDPRQATLKRCQLLGERKLDVLFNDFHFFDVVEPETGS